MKRGEHGELKLDDVARRWYEWFEMIIDVFGKLNGICLTGQ